MPSKKQKDLFENFFKTLSECHGSIIWTSVCIFSLFALAVIVTSIDPASLKGDFRAMISNSYKAKRSAVTIKKPDVSSLLQIFRVKDDGGVRIIKTGILTAQSLKSDDVVPIYGDITQHSAALSNILPYYDLSNLKKYSFFLLAKGDLTEEELMELIKGRGFFLLSSGRMRKIPIRETKAAGGGLGRISNPARQPGPSQQEGRTRIKPGSAILSLFGLEGEDGEDPCGNEEEQSKLDNRSKVASGGTPSSQAHQERMEMWEEARRESEQRVRESAKRVREAEQRLRDVDPYDYGGPESESERRELEQRQKEFENEKKAKQTAQKMRDEERRLRDEAARQEKEKRAEEGEKAFLGEDAEEEEGSTPSTPTTYCLSELGCGGMSGEGRLKQVPKKDLERMIRARLGGRELPRPHEDVSKSVAGRGGVTPGGQASELAAILDPCGEGILLNIKSSLVCDPSPEGEEVDCVPTFKGMPLNPPSEEDPCDDPAADCLTEIPASLLQAMTRRVSQ